MADPVIQAVGVTDASRNIVEGGLGEWERREYAMTFDVTGRTLLEAVREHTYAETTDSRVPRSVSRRDDAVVTRWSDREGRPDLRRVRFQPRDERGVRIGGCSVHRPTECIVRDDFPAEYDSFAGGVWPFMSVHVGFETLEKSIAHAECDWARPPTTARLAYIDAVRHDRGRFRVRGVVIARVPGRGPRSGKPSWP